MIVEYRRATANDAEGMAKLFSEPEVLAGTLQLPMPSADVWRKRLEPQATDPAQIHVVAIADGVLIGSAGLHPITGSLRTRHVMGLGIGVSRVWWGKGVSTELMRLLIDWADNWAGILRIELGVYADNARDRAVRAVRVCTRRDTTRACLARRPVRRFGDDGAASSESADLAQTVGLSRFAFWWASRPAWWSAHADNRQGAR